MRFRSLGLLLLWLIFVISMFYMVVSCICCLGFAAFGILLAKVSSVRFVASLVDFYVISIFYVVASCFCCWVLLHLGFYLPRQGGFGVFIIHSSVEVST
ncbi:Uncharacterized protein TCM_011946 [Theobroma cacao]|uniref:Uncharacterized protein n=1 Tax=Theobroma cacao TaxID=3641 RepID=A0A061G0F9_THECC|nr:Uncharacterized protein TCM_011946 [Theobroma cacao]